jgi:hypothetical protein
MGRLRGFEIEWLHASGCRVNIYDDGTVCYAYFIDRENELSGDVWLYNRSVAPLTPPWDIDGATPPFLNPMRYLDIRQFAPPNKEDIRLSWSDEEDGLLAIIFVRGLAIARLSSGQKPGHSRLVSVSGPLAAKWE